jgi:hypothetical protein
LEVQQMGQATPLFFSHRHGVDFMDRNRPATGQSR